MFVRSYLRASTNEQDATRARASLDAFATERGLTIAANYVETESGTTLVRPELFRLLSDCQPGDVLLVEQVDRLSRLDDADWRKLRAEVDARKVRIVALDLPTSWSLATPADEFTSRMLEAVNGMLMDMLAAIARKDLVDRKRRVAEGRVKAMAEGKFKGRPEDTKRNSAIVKMLAAKTSWTDIQAATGCSRSTIAKLAKREAA